MIQQMLVIWSLVPLPFLNSAETSGSSWFTYYWSLAWRIFEHYFASMWNECNCVVVWTFFGIALLWDWNENWLFQSCGHCWVFQICWQHFHSIIFQDLKQLSWNSHHLHYLCSQWCFLSPISHSRMSGSRWVITSSWLSGSLRSFLYSSSVYPCHILISPASVYIVH